MYFYEIWPRVVAHGDSPVLTYRSDKKLPLGSFVDIEVGHKATIGLVKREVSRPDFATKPLEALDLPPLPAKLVETLDWMSFYYATPWPIVLNNALPKGLAKRRRAKVPQLPATTRTTASWQLSKTQRTKLEELRRSPATAILHGETGSGKTLLYRELIKDSLAAGRSALLLVPEIGLTPQALSDYADLTEHIFVTHSTLTEAQRHKVWLEILQRNTPKLVIGPRSALFSPLENLGVLIIDESHESSYKQDTSPKYHAATVAAYLAKRHGGKLVLGSATPRIQDIYLSQARQLPVVTLPAYYQRQPEIDVIDAKDRSRFKTHAYISQPLLDAIKTSLRAGQQSLVYLNRRGSAQLALCSNCGWSAKCPRCDIGLALHHDFNQLRCHQCGFKSPIPNLCPDCSQGDIRFRGIGTKRLATDLAKMFPQAKVERFDGDSAVGERLHERYGDLYQGKVDILVGTQSIARSLDLPKLETVGVVSAESELLLPDFSAAERTFQLLYQVIGRVGRTTGRGRVIVQTHNPDHSAITHAISHDYAGFYELELKHRQAFGYPPFKHLLALVVAYASRARAQTAASEVADQLRAQPGLSVLGPAPAFYERQGNKYRWLVAVKSPSRTQLADIAASLRSNKWQTDIDPINLLF